jgi:O-succinylbenzoate synthase
MVPVNPTEGAPDPLYSVELLRVSVPLRAVHRSANVVSTTRESIIVRVVDATGSTGISECPTLGVPGYVTETTDEAWQALGSQLAPRWLAGHRVPAPGLPAASAAMADASLDAHLRRQGVSLADHLVRTTATGERSGTASNAVQWCAVIADVALTADLATRAARDAVSSGASMLKFKFNDPSRLREVVEAVRGVTDLRIAADANGSLSPESVRVVDDLDLVYLEQPLPDGTPWSDFARLVDTLATPVCLDESIRSPDALTDAIASGALEVASIKAPRMGGVLNAATAVRLCTAQGIGCFVGGMFELGIGRATALSVAAMPGCTLPSDLGPTARYFDRDLCAPLVTDRTGRVSVPVGAGIGRILHDESLEEYLVDRLLLSV